MGNNTKIEWTDKTWNPIVGCSMVSPGCANCYAETMSKRLAAMARSDIALAKDPGRKEAYLHVLNEKGRWNGHVELVPAALADPLGWRKPARVFVNSMSDLFHRDVPFEYIDRVFAVMALCEQHTFQVLTKRPERMVEYVLARSDSMEIYRAAMSLLIQNRLDRTVGEETRFPLSNVWLGTSVEDQQRADERIPHLLKCPAAVRFLSCEPLLGPLEFSDATRRADAISQLGKKALTGIGWVIVGGESGPSARPMHPDWARSIRDQCVAAGAAFHFKQWGNWYPDDRPYGGYANQRRLDDATLMTNYGGKHVAGRTLDGREWDQFPENMVVA